MFVTIYSRMDCPFCTVSRNALNELEDIYRPYLIATEGYAGIAKPPIQEGTLYNLYYVGYNPRVHQKIERVYDSRTPITEIKPNIILHGADIYISLIQSALVNETLEDVKRILPQAEITKINDGYYDGLDYLKTMNDIISSITGIENETFINNLNHKLNERKKLTNLIFEKLKKK